MKVACIYHNADLDGKCSAAIVRTVYPDAQLIGRNYGDVAPLGILPTVETVFVTDFTLPWPLMDELASRYELNWIDHHIHKMNESQKRNYHTGGLQILNPHFAACELVWMTLRSPEGAPGVPAAVRLLGTYDAWRDSGTPYWESAVMPFQCAMQAMDFSVDDNLSWAWLFAAGEERIAEIISRGDLVYSFKKQQYATLAKAGGLVEWEGHTWWVVNSPVSGSMADRGIEVDHDGVICYYWDQPKGCYKFSLRSVAGSKIDVGAIATRHGGSGHVGAAGFQSLVLPWVEE